MWKRIIAPTILVIVMWFAVSVVTTFYIRWLYETHSRMLTEDVTSIRAAEAMQAILWQMQTVVANAEDTSPAEIKNEVRKLVAIFERHLAEAEKTSYDSEEDVLVKTIKDQFTVFRDKIQNRLIVQEQNKPSGMAADENQKTMHLARAVAKPCQKLIEVNERSLADATIQSNQLGNLINLLRFGFLIAGPIVGVIFGLWVARGFRHSISQISITLNDATDEMDDEVSRVDVYMPDDLPTLQAQVQVVASRIRQVMVELEKARRKVRLSERLAAVGELAAEMAHEIRNPLTGIKLLIQTAAQRQPDHVLSEKHLQVIMQEITRIENTIQGLLDFSRPPKLHRVPHDLRDTVRRALNLITDHAKRQEVILTEDFPSAPVIVDGDPEQIHQVFVNLAFNGIEAMTHGGTLHVSIHKNDDGNGMCSVAFGDSGSGISPEILARIFEPFTSTKEHGTGLGLAISRRIVEEHGGSLLVENLESGGALFTVELPLSKTYTHDKPVRGGTTTSAEEKGYPPLSEHGSEATDA